MQTPQIFERDLLESIRPRRYRWGDGHRMGYRRSDSWAAGVSGAGSIQNFKIRISGTLNLRK